MRASIKMPSVLLVEDYPSLQKLYEMTLVDRGFKVTVVNNGNAALELLAKHSFDIILLDILLPGIDGLEVMRRYVPREHPETKVLILTNFLKAGAIKEATELGIKRYLEKTALTPTQLVDIMKEELTKQ